MTVHFLRVAGLTFALGILLGKLVASPVAEVPATPDETMTKTYTIADFKRIYLEGSFKVILQQGTQSGLKITTDEDNFEYIDVDSNPGSLNLKITKKHFDFDKIVLHITFKDLEKLVIEGGMKLETVGYVNLNDFYMHVEGGASVKMNLKANNLTVIGEGGTTFELDGVANSLNASVSGAGNLDAEDLKVREAKVKIEGFGAASVFPTEYLDAIISGVGKIKYHGSPQIRKEISGIGIVSGD